MRKILIIAVGIGVLIGLFFSVASFFKRQTAQNKKKLPPVQLLYYRFGESSQSLLSQIQAYQKKYPNVKITIQEFYDLEEYEDRIINEMAEGRGPDIFSMPNDWIYRHQNKLVPMPEQLMSIDTFRKTFVEVADRDLVRPDSAGLLRIYGIPFFIDTLAIYYNKSHFEDRLSSRGIFAQTWDQFALDIYRLTKLNNNVFQVAGAALGRTDNISMGVDILYSLMLQMGTDFYDKTYKAAVFSNAQKGNDGKTSTPGNTALSFFTSFSQKNEKNYSWNKNVTDNDENEIDAFARGNVSVIFGYSDTYEQIKKAIDDHRAKKEPIIEVIDIQVAPFPQLEDPSVSTKKRVVLGKYFAEAVSRNSKFSLNAWNFIKFLSEKENLQTYHSISHKPTSRRDLIETQKKEPFYGVFAEQSAFAVSAPIYHQKKFYDVFNAVVLDIVDGNETSFFAFKQAQDAITRILPKSGFLGPGPYVLPAEQQAKK